MLHRMATHAQRLDRIARLVAKPSVSSAAPGWDQSNREVITERDAKLHGLGTSDMKAFLALALEAVQGLNPDTLREPLLLLATADEESTMDGARALVALGRPRGRYALIGGPTDL